MARERGPSTTPLVDLARQGARMLPSRAEPYTAEDVLRGLIGHSDWRYALEALVDYYQRGLAMLPIAVGDTVRVRKPYWWMGSAPEHAPGWHGYTPMFADATGTATDIRWVASRGDWVVRVRYDDPYRWIQDRQEFYVDSFPASFTFNAREVERVVGTKVKTQDEVEVESE